MKKTLIALATTALVTLPLAANALTLKKGEVLTTSADGTQVVAPAHETANGKALLERDGYLISGGMLYVLIEGELIGSAVENDEQEDVVVELPVEEIKGKSNDEIVEMIVEEVEEVVMVEIEGIEMTEAAAAVGESLSDEIKADIGAAIEAGLVSAEEVAGILEKAAEMGIDLNEINSEEEAREAGLID